MKKVMLALGLCAVISAPAFANDHADHGAAAADHAGAAADHAAAGAEQATTEATTTTTKSKKKMKARAKKADKAAHEGAAEHN